MKELELNSSRAVSYVLQSYPEYSFGGYTDVDGTICFYTRVNSLITPLTVLLDFGCGGGTYAHDTVRLRRDLRIFRNRVARTIGLDVDEMARRNHAGQIDKISIQKRRPAFQRVNHLDAIAQ